MDTLSHALSGALLARAAGRDSDEAAVGCRTRAGFLAAAFPDLDYALYWLDPVHFLAWHRGVTHSLLLLPLWAALLTVLLLAAPAWRRRWPAVYLACCLGLAAHVAGDVITVYGTRILAPVASWEPALYLAFDLDPYIAAAVALGFLGVVRWHRPWAGAWALALILGYLTLQAGLQQRTLSLGEEFARARGLTGVTVRAIPQPIGPFAWSVVVSAGEVSHLARVSHLPVTAALAGYGPPWSLLGAYAPPGRMRWTRHRLTGSDPATQPLAREAWAHPRMAAFRRFARLPALYRIDRQGEAACVWFTDLRHALPGMEPAFRQGLCRTRDDAPWRAYRLRYFSADVREPLD